MLKKPTVLYNAYFVNDSKFKSYINLAKTVSYFLNSIRAATLVNFKNITDFITIGFNLSKGYLQWLTFILPVKTPAFLWIDEPQNIALLDKFKIFATNRLVSFYAISTKPRVFAIFRLYTQPYIFVYIDILC